MGLFGRIFGRREVKKEVANPVPLEVTKPVVEKIPESILKTINKLQEEKGQLLNKFLNVSAQIVNTRKQQVSTLEEIETKGRRIKQEMDFAFSKLKLDKKTNYRWGYDGQGNFVGTLISKQKVNPPKK